VNEVALHFSAFADLVARQVRQRLGSSGEVHLQDP